jgi:hypothetical protein
VRHYHTMLSFIAVQLHTSHSQSLGVCMQVQRVGFKERVQERHALQTRLWGSTQQNNGFDATELSAPFVAPGPGQQYVIITSPNLNSKLFSASSILQVPHLRASNATRRVRGLAMTKTSCGQRLRQTPTAVIGKYLGVSLRCRA